MSQYFLILIERERFCWAFLLVVRGWGSWIVATLYVCALYHRQRLSRSVRASYFTSHSRVPSRSVSISHSHKLFNDWTVCASSCYRISFDGWSFMCSLHLVYTWPFCPLSLRCVFDNIAIFTHISQAPNVNSPNNNSTIPARHINLIFLLLALVRCC